MMKVNLFVLGAGGHAKVLLDCLLDNQHVNVLGILDRNPALKGEKLLGIPVLGHEDDILKNYPVAFAQLVNGIGSIGLASPRQTIFSQFKQQGYQFFSVIHPKAYVAREVIIGEGAQLMAGVVIQPGCKIGNNVIINTHAAIDHDCEIMDHVHLAPGVTCCGNVSVGYATHVGCGAVIKQNVKIDEQCMIAAGSVVVKNVTMGSKMAGVPAKNME